MKPNILFVDDERQFSEMTKEYLEAKGFNVTLKHNGDSALVSFKKNDFHLCVLDVKMPIKDGFTLAKEIRGLNEHVPIIFLTGQSQKEDRIKGLSLGADDYITKPFSMQELFLRIKNILKRVRFEQRTRKEIEKYSFGIFDFDATSRELRSAGKTKNLTAIESNLLQMFCENRNDVIERNLALKRIWGDDEYLRGRSLNVYVSKLRTLTKADQNIEFLNIHGVGYKMVIKNT